MTDIVQLVQAASFIPSNRQIRARAEFHVRNPSLPEPLTAEQAVQCGAPNALLKWWATPGFADWWTNPSWEKEEAQRLLHQSMQRVSEILRESEDDKNIIAAAREAREIYSKLHTSVVPKFADEEVAGMTRAQLEEYIRRKSQAIAK